MSNLEIENNGQCGKGLKRYRAYFEDGRIIISEHPVGELVLYEEHLEMRQKLLSTVDKHLNKVCTDHLDSIYNSVVFMEDL